MVSPKAAVSANYEIYYHDSTQQPFRALFHTSGAEEPLAMGGGLNNSRTYAKRRELNISRYVVGQ